MHVIVGTLILSCIIIFASARPESIRDRILLILDFNKCHCQNYSVHDVWNRYTSIFDDSRSNNKIDICFVNMNYTGVELHKMPKSFIEKVYCYDDIYVNITDYNYVYMVNPHARVDISHLLYMIKNDVDEIISVENGTYGIKKIYPINSTKAWRTTNDPNQTQNYHRSINFMMSALGHSCPLLQVYH